MAGETVTVVRPASTTNRYGDTVDDWDNATRTDVAGAKVAPAGGSALDAAGRQGVTYDLEVVLPAGTDLADGDHVEVRGATYRLAGPVEDWRSPFTSRRHGLVVPLTRTEG